MAPPNIEDAWIRSRESIVQIEKAEDDTTIAVEASHYLQNILSGYTSQEPLLTALGGLMSIGGHIKADLKNWDENGLKALFVFDGQPMTGQDEVSVARGKHANEETDKAWDLYFKGNAAEAVTGFGINRGAFRIQNLYPLLQGILAEKGIVFWVAPQNAAAQVAYLDQVGTVGGIMGSQELLLYPIYDSVIRSINWETKQFTVGSKNALVKELNVTPTVFIDALLMTGTSFLPTFPPLKEPSITTAQPYTIQDAVNMLRTTEKSVASVCTSFNDILQKQDPDWLDKYQKARMAVNHFLYMDTDTNAIKVANDDNLTGDNPEYLGLRLPEEIYHYLGRGLTSGRLLSWITHKKITILPTLDGVRSEEYKKLITSQLVPTYETALGLVIPRLHRGIQFMEIELKVWFDDGFSHKITNHRNLKPNPGDQASTWDVSEEVLKGQQLPSRRAGSIGFELLALKDPKFAKATVSKAKPTSWRQKSINSAEMITSVATWRFLHHRGYVNDSHELTAWGKALALAMTELEVTVKENPDVPGLDEALLLAFDLIRYDLLNAKNPHAELFGLPMTGTEADRDSLLLISRCAVLLKLRHEENGYTGPLSKNLLAFFSQVAAVREANRDLVEATIISMFIWAQCERNRDDEVEISSKLPFADRNPNVAMGIAVKTYLDDVHNEDTPTQRVARLAEFAGKFVPFAIDFQTDLSIFGSFFNALNKGVQSVEGSEMSAADKAEWDKAATYLNQRL